MTTYKIIGKTNPWIAQRDSLFNGKTEITIEDNLSLKEAQKRLLDFFNEDYNTCYPNWGLAIGNHRFDCGSHKDGTRYYNYDSRCFSIEEEDEEKWYCSSYNALDKEGNVDMYVCPDCDYFKADNDEAAIEHAKQLANEGTSYCDTGHIELELISVCRVDPENEWDEIETVWF